MGVAPFVLAFHVSVTEVRVTSVTSGLEGALGIRFGSVGLPGWTAAPNSERNPNPKHVYFSFKHTHNHSADFRIFSCNEREIPV